MNKIEEFVSRCQEVVDRYMQVNFPGMRKVLSIERGKRYARIVAFDGVSRSAWAFVDMATGDVLKPASWKVPAKHARGNINDEFGGMRYISSYGPAYLR
jgi:hypothetical protein